MARRFNSCRMALTAAWSAAISSPRPRRRAAATAARSVTRTSSRVRMRSSDGASFAKRTSWFIDGLLRRLLGEWLDPDHLRVARDVAVGLDRVEGLADGGLGRLVGNQD